MTAQEFFAALPEKADPAKTAGMHNTYVFDVEGVGQWTVAVDDGTVSVTEGAGEADCTIRASEETLVKIARGEAIVDVEAGHRAPPRRVRGRVPAGVTPR